MCKTGAMSGLGLLFKKMMKMQSPRLQCCLCGCSVMSAMVGMFMLSAGVCLVLNYNFLEVDTSGLPPNLHNDEGKKVVGIILICVGIFLMVIGGLVSTIYFAACGSGQQPHTTITPENGKQRKDSSEGAKHSHGRPPSNDGHPHHPHAHHHRHLHGNGMAQGRSSPSLSTVPGSRPGGSLPSLRGGSDPQSRSHTTLGKDGPSYSRSKSRNHTPPSSSSRSHRRKKGRSHVRYHNPLAPHPEEAGVESQSLNESRRSASSRRLQGEVNRGADLDEDLEMARGALASGGSSGSSVSHTVTIKVDSPNVTYDTSPSHTFDSKVELETEFTTDSSETVGYDENKAVSHVTYDDNEDDDGSSRISRSTTDSLDYSEGTPEHSQAAKQRFDDQVQELVS